MKEQPIDTAQIDLAGLQAKEFGARQQFRICMGRQAHEAVWEHARQSVAAGREKGSEIVEVGGILIGNVYKDHEGPFLEITAAIIGEHTKNEGTQMTFTPETWMHVNQVKNKEYPGARVVGWYHTHPRFGIFLSDMDKFIHKHHFPQPWTTAFVVDPVQGSEGFFVWSEGEPSAAGEYWVGHQRREPGRANNAPMEKETREDSPRQQEVMPAAAAFDLVLSICFLAVLVLFGYMFWRETGHSENEKVMLQVLDSQSAELQNSSQALMAAGGQLMTVRKEGSDADEQIRRRLVEVEAGLQRSLLMTTLLQAKLTNRHDILDRIQSDFPGLIPSGEKPKEQKQDAGQQDPGKQNSTDQNAAQPNPDKDKKNRDQQNPAGQDAGKQNKDQNTDKHSNAPGEVKK